MRRAVALVAVVGAAAGGFAYVNSAKPPWYERLRYPLAYEQIVSGHARHYRLDPALVAAVIYQESKFRPRTSAAGAKGLMQILPSTAKAIAKRSGGTAFVPSDLATPQVNISYGTYYLRYLIDHYGGSVTPAIAAYNAGLTNVDGWVRKAGGAKSLTTSDIPFPETRAYVESVFQHQKDYRAHYAHELGYR